MKPNFDLIKKLYDNLDSDTKSFLDKSIKKIIDVKKHGGKIMVATGSGPNVHEGVTTLIAELIDKGIVDSVTTSSAVVAHEMGGTLDKVKRVEGKKINLKHNSSILPRGDIFEFTLLDEDEMKNIKQEMIIDDELIKKGNRLDGDTIIKAAGNMGYPMGLRTELLAKEILSISKDYDLPFETVVGWGADRKTMIGIGVEKSVPVLVTVPQLVGGGAVGLAIGDSIPISERCMKIAKMAEDADVIIESAVVLTQEIHDGPFETYTGHAIWASWTGYRTYSLKDKTLIRIDLDSNLKRAWSLERESKKIQEAIDKGLPKTKITGIPFRMEMSAFSRLEGSIPIVGDIGIIWPIIAWQVPDALGISFDFISYPQQTEEGKAMREWIVNNVKPIDRNKIIEKAKSYKSY